MILHELTLLYNRLAASPETDIPEPGFSMENISFIIRVDQEGRFIDIDDQRIDEKPSRIEMPKLDGKRAGAGKKPYFLWDNTKYVFGRELKGNKENQTPDFEEAFISFNKKVVKEINLSNTEVNAVLKFLDSSGEKIKVMKHNYWPEMLNTFVTFKVNSLVAGQTDVKQAWKRYLEIIDGQVEKKLCLVSGESGPVYAIHPTIKRGIGDKNDIPLISFNINCSESYDLKSNYNASVQRKTAASFTHSLNYLVEKSNHHINIADTKTLFWAENEDPFEEFFGEIFGKRADNPDSPMLEAALKRMRSGKLPDGVDNTKRFFILGLVPNSARVSVRFWCEDTIENITKAIGNHYQHLQIIKENEKDDEFPSIWQLIIETATQHKSENIPPNIAGPIMRSILHGNIYPKNILSILTGRMRTDQGYSKLNYYRAAFIKAILNRNFKKELTMSLDPTRKTTPYLLGRLFSILEKVQEESSGGKLNATIKDRFFASASTTPRVVFPRLINLHQNHMKKLKGDKVGLSIVREKLVGEVIADLPPNFPASLKLEDQGEFAIGYYHQRQDFFTKKEEQTIDDNLF